MDGPMPMYCNNQVVIYIASNPFFHERTKHTEMNCHFVRDAMSRKLISTLFTSYEKLADMFIPRVFSYLCNKLDAIDSSVPT